MRQFLNWFRRGKLERGLDRELVYHMDRRVSDLVAAGLPEQEARRQARLELGGLTQVREEVRDVWLTPVAARFRAMIFASPRDAFFAVRRSPPPRCFRSRSASEPPPPSTRWSIRCCCTRFRSVQPERLVLIDWKGDQAASGFGSWNLMSYPICRDLQLQDRFFEGVLCRAATTVNLSTGGEPKPAAAEIVSGSYFSVLGVGPGDGKADG